MNLFIEEIEGSKLNILMDGNRVVEIHSVKDGEVQLDSVYVGKVYKIKQSIKSAFLKISGNIDVYLPIRESNNYLYVKNTNGKNTLCQGDEILVQIIKYGSGEKLCTVSSSISLKSDNFILVNDKAGSFISKKIQNREIKKLIKKNLNEYKAYNIGIIARTSSQDIDLKDLDDELNTLLKKYMKIVSSLSTYPSNICVYNMDREDNILKELKRKYDFTIFTKNDQIASSFNNVQLLNKEDFDDKMRMYSVKDRVKRLKFKKFLLKSGANIVIEKTEAMYVIDVNSHKSAINRDNEKAVYKTNLEAAKEICKQVIARNLSGIIVVDFINMSNPDLEKTLIENMKKFSIESGAKLLIHGLTRLSLMEISRKKSGHDIYEDEVVQKFLK